MKSLSLYLGKGRSSVTCIFIDFEFYKAKGLLKTVNGDQSADAVTVEVLEVLDRL